MHSLYLRRRGALALVVCLALAVSALQPARAQDSKDFAVLLSATIDRSPQPTITLHWNNDQYATAYSVFRKNRGDAGWPQTPLATLDSTAVSYVDDNVEIGKAYEYQVFKQALHKLSDTSGLPYIGTGYIYAGIDLLPVLNRGKVLLLVDTTMSAPLAKELERLRIDLVREGWTVTRRTVRRSETFDATGVLSVKDAVVAEYNAAPKNLKAVFIIGRVAVPYSGKINPDGHNDHIGAWPCDGYYGDINGTWTDVAINDSSAGRKENWNKVEDGKFDQSTFPTPLELQVGRVDFYNMPSFALSETELLRRYLDKDHAFRTNQIKPRLAGIIDDNFSAASYQEAFASAGWRNLSLFGGPASVTSGDWFEKLGGDTVLWAYGCGGGTYTSAGGIGSTSDFASKPVHAVFTMLFGSYFGDWDHGDNFLRAAIAGEGTALTCSWVARPQWYYHPMALGETVGSAALLSQNNGSTYIPNVYFTAQYPNGLLVTFGNKMTHIALMGDPTLRAQMSPIPLPNSFGSLVPGDGPAIPKLFWSSSEGKVDGYLIWRASAKDSTNYQLITETPITDTTYIDTKATGDVVFYRLQPVLLRETASGTYYDAGGSVELRSQLAAAPVEHQPASFSASVAPNPARDEAIVSAVLEESSTVTVEIHDISGERVARLAPGRWQAGENQVRWDLRDAHGKRVPAGVYVATILTGKGMVAVKVVVGGGGGF